MPAPRKPTNILRLSGAFKKNPQRLASRAHEPQPTGPIGSPPSWFDALETECWHNITNEAPAGVLTNADRGIVELAAELRAKVIRRDADGRSRALLRMVYNELGMTPASRSKVSAVQPETKANPFSAI